MLTPMVGDDRFAPGDLSVLKSHATRAWLEWRTGKRLFVFGGIALYVIIVVTTQSLLATVAGAAVLLTLRIWSVEQELYYRLIFLGDLAVDLHNHRHLALTEIEQTIGSNRFR